MKNHSQIKKHYRSCNLCEAICGLAIEHRHGHIVSIKGDPDDPLSKGHICPKALALQDIYNDPKRIKKPLKKVKGKWQEISWQQAYREAGKKIKHIQHEYGNNAIALYQGNPTVHNYGSILFNANLRKALGTKNNYSATSLDQLPHQYVAQLMFGHPLMIPVPDIDRTDFFLIMGGNPLVSNGSMMTAPGMAQRIKNVQKRSGKVIVIDPKRTETAKKADAHLFIKPATDVYLLLAMLNEVFVKGKVQPNKIASYIHNLSKIEALVQPYTADKVAPITGIKAEDIRWLVSEFTTAKTAVCYGRIGVSVQKYGTICQWLINVLNIITGNFDKAGGHMFTKPAVNVRRGKGRSSTPRWHSRVSNKPEIMGELPMTVLAEEITTPGVGKIRALIVSAGNPASSAPNGNKMAAALTQLDYMVAIDIFQNATNQYADLILPPATGLEVDHYDLAFNSLAVRNVAKYSPALFKPASGTQYDWQIFKNLANHVKRPLSLKGRLMNWWLTPAKMLNIGLKSGPFGKKTGLNLKKLMQNQHGIDFGPLTPMLPEGLLTKDKKINLAPEILSQGLGAVAEDFATQKKTHKLTLISRRNLRSNNSWMHGIERLAGGSNRCTLQINPQDAQGLADGTMVTVTSATGAISVLIKTTADMMPGVVSLPFGWNKKSTHAASYNDLVDESNADTLTGNAGFSGVEVVVTNIYSDSTLN